MLKKVLVYLASIVLINLVLPTTSFVQAAEVVSYQPPITEHIRVLAASCAACHGTNGNAVRTEGGLSLPILAGMDAGYFVTQMLAFKSGERKATVMHHHAKGLNIDEINLLANYFSQQKRIAGISPKPQEFQSQELKADHE